MRKSIFKSKIVTGAMALMLTVSMMPGMAIAESMENAENDSMVAEAARLEAEAMRIDDENLSQESSRNDVWSSITAANGVTVSVSTTVENLVIAAIENQSNQYEIKAVSGNYFPQNFSMKVEPNATVTATNGANFDYYNAPYGVVTMGTGATLLTVTRNGASFTIACPAPNDGGSPGTGLEAYLPGYGQFANEGIDSGGWGDGYTSGTAGRKNMVGAVSSTGLSLGSFGGYAVFKFDRPVKNSNRNKYGIDFIVYGNAFVGNSEPGGIQVSQDGSTWYNIAGSRHYMEDTVWDSTATYTNPSPDDNDLPSPPSSPNNVTGSAWTADHPYNLQNVVKPWQTSPVNETVNVVYNPWHSHSWFPLDANYFTIRKANELPLANYAAYNFANYDAVNSQLTLKGVKTAFPSTSGNDYTFGYCDVHPNGNNYGVAVNPYTAVANTQGGDGIDISWAVNSSGEPVYLSDIQYVRVYTGVATMNPTAVFGEVSTEVTGVYKASRNFISVGQTAKPTIKLNNNAVVHSNMRAQAINLPANPMLTIESNADNIYVNGERYTGSQIVNLPQGQQKYLQIIVQTGNRLPYITVFKLN